MVKESKDEETHRGSHGVYHAHESRYNLNFPWGDGTIGVAKDKIILMLMK